MHMSKVPLFHLVTDVRVGKSLGHMRLDQGFKDGCLNDSSIKIIRAILLCWQWGKVRRYLYIGHVKRGIKHSRDAIGAVFFVW